MNNTKAINQKLNARYMFPKVFNAAMKVNAHYTEVPDLPTFMKSFSKELKKLPTKSHALKTEENLLLVEQTFMIQVIAAEMDIESAALILRRKMLSTGMVLIGFVVQLGQELRWQRVQISERWLKTTGESQGDAPL